MQKKKKYKMEYKQWWQYFRSVYLAGTGLQTLTAIVPALVGCPEHSTLGHASSRLPRAFNFRGCEK